MQLFVTWASLMINSVSFFFMALSISDKRSTPMLSKSRLHFLHHSSSMSLHSNLADAEFATDLLIQQPTDR